MEDVWVNPTTGPVPRWLTDANVRKGIRAMLKSDRCLEERRRLGLEADNLCQWFGCQIAAVTLALKLPASKCIPLVSLNLLMYQTDSFISVPLTQHSQDILRLRSLWKTTFVSDHRYEFHLRYASSKTSEILGDEPLKPVTWVLTAVAPVTLHEDSESDCESEDNITGDLLAEALEDDENHDQTLVINMSWQVPVGFLLLLQSCFRLTSTF